MENQVQFESFNARYLSFESIAESFIPNKVFGQLLAMNHSVIMGPRGCGKTTSLKMLNPKAFYKYKKENNFSDDIIFWGIYIPTDKQWESQFEYMNSLFEEKSKIPELLSSILVSINIVIATCNCFSDLIELSSDEISFDLEPELAKEIVNILQLDKPISPNLYSIIQQLYSHVSDLNVLLKKRYFFSLDIETELKRFLIYEDFLLIIEKMCTAFEFVYKQVPFFQGKDFKWALCFDELEIAPDWLRSKLFNVYLRSTYQKFIFKITSTPIIDWRKISTFSDTIPSDGNDYDTIRTWVYDQDSNERWIEFCERLFTEVIRKNTVLKKINIQDIFGKNDYIEALRISEPNSFPETKLKKRDFDKGSSIWLLYQKLAEKDPSFNMYLENNHIDVKHYDSKAIKKVQDSVLRKIKPIVAFRYYLKGENSLRTRKEIHLYHGLPLIYELTDGNPRSAINIINDFIARFEIKDNTILPLQISTQASVISSFSQKRINYFKSYPNSSVTLDKKDISMGDLLIAIGTYFYKTLIGETFKPEPPTCFTVDKDLPSCLIDLIDLALSLGAIQDVDSFDENVPEIRGRRFRLSYVLHPFFKLPKRANGNISLKKIIQVEILKGENLSDSGQTLIEFPNEN